MTDAGPPPLDGIRVLSLGHTLPGLYCIAILRDLGADVTRVERVAPAPERWGAIAGQFPTRSLDAGTGRCGIDLKAPRGATLFRRLATAADVVLEGFRPGTAARLGVGYDTLAAANPRLVYAAISGYGQDGPWRDRAGHDVDYLAATGALGLAGEPGRPPMLPGLTYADGLAGLGAAINVVAALGARQCNGRGRFLDIAIVDGPLFLMSAELEHQRATGHSRTRGDTHLTGAYPWYGVYECADGKHLAVGAVEKPFYDELCHRLGHPELIGRQFATGAEREAQAATLRDAFRSRPRDDWVAALGAACVAPVLSPAEAAQAPHTARGRRDVPGSPTPLVRSPVCTPAPLGPARDTMATLAAFGIAAHEVRALREEGVIGP